MRTVAYYHVYLPDNVVAGTDLVLEQLKHIEDSGLLSNLDQIRVSCVTQTDGRERIFTNLCKSYPGNWDIDLVKNPYSNDREMVENLESSTTVTEEYTYKKLWNDALKEDLRILYFHTKGVTSYIRNLYSFDVETYKTYYYWREFLNWGVLENWRKCVDALDQYDIAGVNYQTEPSKHFSGNFWWTTSNHIRTLPDPSSKDWFHKLKQESNDPWFRTAGDRFKEEQWVCSRPDTQVFNLVNLESNKNPAKRTLVKADYTNL